MNYFDLRKFDYYKCPFCENSINENYLENHYTLELFHKANYCTDTNFCKTCNIYIICSENRKNVSISYMNNNIEVRYYHNIYCGNNLFCRAFNGECWHHEPYENLYKFLNKNITLEDIKNYHSEIMEALLFS